MAAANAQPHNGYTILELSITLTIIAVLIVGGLTSFNQHTQTKRLNITQERLERIEAALQHFVQQYNYLPCPNDQSFIESNASFGLADTYSESTHSCTNISDNTGAVPVYTLQLPSSFSYDGWGRKFTYRIASGLGDKDTFLAQLPHGDYFSGDLKIIDSYGIEKTSMFYHNPRGAAYILFSHGANGLGAWHKNSTEAPGTNINDLEEENINHAINKRYIQSFSTPYFDDILRFKEKAALYPQSYQSPIIISQQTCSNAYALVQDGNPSIHSNDLASYTNAHSASALTSQIYKSAQTIAQLCSNPPIIPVPLDISHPTLWLDATDHSTILPSPNGNVTTWNDKSGNNHDLTQSSSFIRPNHTLDATNGLSTVTFALGDYLTREKLYGKNIFASNSSTAFFVIRHTSGGAGATWLQWKNGAHNVQLSMLASGFPNSTFDDGIGGSNVSISAGMSSLSIITMIKSSTPGSTNTLTFSLYPANNASSANTSTLDLNNAQSLTLGIDTDILNGWAGDIGEVIIYNRALTASEQSRIQQYLAEKWLLL